MMIMTIMLDVILYMDLQVIHKSAPVEGTPLGRVTLSETTEA